MRNNVVIMLFAGLLTACATVPSETDLANADYGDYPENYQQLITEYLNEALLDPESARIEWVGKPHQGHYAYLGKFTFGYIACARVNAKNVYGGYTGAALDSYLIKNGRIVERRAGASDGEGLYDYFNLDICFSS